MEFLEENQKIASDTKEMSEKKGNFFSVKSPWVEVEAQYIWMKREGFVPGSQLEKVSRIVTIAWGTRIPRCMPQFVLVPRSISYQYFSDEFLNSA